MSVCVHKHLSVKGGRLSLPLREWWVDKHGVFWWEFWMSEVRSVFILTNHTDYTEKDKKVNQASWIKLINIFLNVNTSTSPDMLMLTCVISE